MSSEDESQTRIKIPRKQIEQMIVSMLEEKLKHYVTRDEARQLIRAASKDSSLAPSMTGATMKPAQFLPEIVKSYQCPDGNCGQIHENPNYKKAEAYCSSCGNAYGTVEDAKKAEKCPGCGSTDPAIRVDMP